MEVVEGRINLEDMRGELKSTENLKRAGTIYIDTLSLEDLVNVESARIQFGRKVSTKVKNYIQKHFVVDRFGNIIRKELVEDHTV